MDPPADDIIVVESTAAAADEAAVVVHSADATIPTDPAGSLVGMGVDTGVGHSDGGGIVSDLFGLHGGGGHVPVGTVADVATTTTSGSEWNPIIANGGQDVHYEHNSPVVWQPISRDSIAAFWSNVNRPIQS